MFASHELDSLLNSFPKDGRFIVYDYKNGELSNRQDDCLRHLTALGYCEIDEILYLSNRVIRAAALTKEGLVFRNNGGIAAVERAKREEEWQRESDRRTTLKAAWVGGLSGGVIGLIASLLVYFLSR